MSLCAWKERTETRQFSIAIWTQSAVFVPRLPLTPKNDKKRRWCFVFFPQKAAVSDETRTVLFSLSQFVLPPHKCDCSDSASGWIHTHSKCLKPSLSSLSSLSLSGSGNQRGSWRGLCVCVCVSIIKATHLPSALSASPRCTVQPGRPDRERTPFFCPSWLTAKVQHYLELWFLWSFCLAPPIEDTKWVWREPNTAPSRFSSPMWKLQSHEWSKKGSCFHEEGQKNICYFICIFLNSLRIRQTSFL